MNEREIYAAIDDFPQKVVGYAANDDDCIVHEGVLLGYSKVPVVLILLEDGSIQYWRMDLTRMADGDKADQGQTAHG